MKRLDLRLPILLLSLGMFHSTRVSSATFTITHLGAPPAAQAAIDQAAEIWGGILVSSVPIKVQVIWAPLVTGLLGITFPNGRRDFPGAPMPFTWYATALANAIANAELNPGENDIDVYLNASVNWYAGLDGMPGPGQYDLVSVALHELGHGLGFVGLAKKVGTEGSFGLLQAADFAPLTTSFPWPQLDTLPGVFDRFLKNNTPELLCDLPNPSVVLGAAFTSDQVYWDGAFGLAGSSGPPVRMYAPATFALGSSCVHLNESTYPPGNANELMTPNGSPGNANHWPGPIALGIMRDIGWELLPDVGMDECPGTDVEPWFLPALAQDYLFLQGFDQGAVPLIYILDLHGRIVKTQRGGQVIDLHGITSGMYIIMRESPAGTERGSFVKQ